MRVIHVTELRAALDQARLQLQLPALTYTPISAGGVIRAIHLQELRNGVK